MESSKSGKIAKTSRHRSPPLPAALTAALCILAAFLLATGPAAALGPDLLVNGSFEDGEGSVISGWGKSATDAEVTMVRDASTAVHGTASAHINHPTTLNDSFWAQVLQLEPNTLYVVSGWIRTENVAGGAGANLNMDATGQQTPGLYDTQDWTQVGMVVDSGDDGVVTIAARLGNWGSGSSGSAWFDGLQVNHLDEGRTTTHWHIQLLVLDKVEAEIVDSAGATRQIQSIINQDDKDKAFQTVQDFVDIDIPALTSGNMVPTLLKTVGTLTKLQPIGIGGYWPAPWITRPLHDPTADSVIVVWKPHAKDVETDETVLLNGNAGLMLDTGKHPTHMAVVIDAVNGVHSSRNTLKQKYGHSLLAYFHAIGASPVPRVTKFPDADDYVNCETGNYYNWVDETLENPIPNSIYNNNAGFTHDYFSGTTALASAPDRCLGITPDAWAHGGPVSGIPLPYLPDALLCSSDSDCFADAGRLALDECGDVWCNEESNMCEFNAWVEDGDCEEEYYEWCDHDDAKCTKGPMGSTGTCTGWENTECVYTWYPAAKCEGATRCHSDSDCITDPGRLDLEECGDVMCNTGLGNCKFNAWKESEDCMEEYYEWCDHDDAKCIKGPAGSVGTCTGWSDHECVYSWCLNK